MSLLVAGPGVGLHAYDGSIVQPGVDAPRPRGFTEEQLVPAAAQVGVSSSVAALMAAHAQDGTLPWRELTVHGQKLAAAAGAHKRAHLIERVGAAGSAALREPSFAEAYLEAAGRAVGGNVTKADLDAAKVQLAIPNIHDDRVAQMPAPTYESPTALHPLVACACDAKGVIAVLHASHDSNGVHIPSFELQAPRLAAPVRRGIARVSPGTRLCMPVPCAILLERGVAWAAVGIESVLQVAPESFAGLAQAGLSIDQSLRELLTHVPGCRGAAAVVRVSDGAGHVRALRIES
jgi:hypothetical protein